MILLYGTQEKRIGREYIPIFPFGCNNSQYKAVKNAMENQISVIQGPPGTGKTQTILNIIANILMQGKTVQIVSNNNSATENVYEKLSSPKYNLGFVAATLGSSKNKKLFVEHQDAAYPDFSSWKTGEDPSVLQKGIAEQSSQLKSVFDKQEKLACLRQELSQLVTEQEYFNQYVKESDVHTDSIKFKKKLSSKQWMLSTESILSISFTSSLSRYGGDLAVGAMTIITSVSQLATLPLQGICQGGQPIMSYNYGAGNRDRVKKAFFTQFTICTIFTGCFWLIMLLFPKIFAGIFSNNTELITYTAWALRIYMAGIFSLGFQVACQQSFMALGQAKVSLLLACLRKLILLIPLIFILPHFIQNKVFAVFLAEPISDILAAIITTSTFFSQFNKILDRK